MNIEEVKRLRLQLGADITEMITTFQRDTSCTVTAVDIQHFFSDAVAEPISTRVNVKVEVPGL